MSTFGREARLRRADEFLEVRKRGVRARCGVLLLSILPGDHQRLGIVVTRKVGIAVERNRIRRVIREYFRVHREHFPLGDCVVIPGVGTARLTNSEIREVLARTLRQITAKLQG